MMWPKNRMIPVMKSFRYETRVEHVSAEIESSLFASVMSIGEKDQLALDLAEIFGSDIDFYTDIQKGDSFRVLIEKKYLDGQFSKYGAILAADFTNQQKVLTGILFEDEHGKPAYYAPDGNALKKSFLKVSAQIRANYLEIFLRQKTPNTEDRAASPWRGLRGSNWNSGPVCGGGSGDQCRPKRGKWKYGEDTAFGWI